MSDASRERKTRGSRIRTTREEKEARREAKRPGDDGSVELHRGSDFAPEPFVDTDAVRDVRDRVERWLSVGRPVHLVGPTGCGKTALAFHVAAERDRPVAVLNGDERLDTADLVGSYAERQRYSVRDQFVHDVVKKKEVERDRWVDGTLTVAAREGATLVYNEFSRSKPAANNVLLSALEEGVLELPGKRGEDRFVEVHPEFRVVFTSNDAEYAGVHEPQDALLDRLVGIHLDFYDEETEAEIVAAHVDDVSRERVETIVEAVRTVRGELDFGVGIRSAIMAAEGVTVAGDDALEQCCVDAMASKAATKADIDDLRDVISDVIDQ